MSSDLHMHTTFSDGGLTPEKLVLAAKQAGLHYMAITDHDTVGGIRNLYENGLYPAKGIELIPGIEFSVQDPEHEVHILGYNIDIFNVQLQEKLDEVVEHRWIRFSQIIEKLQTLGYPISETDVLTVAGATKSIGRAHIARALVKKGCFKTMGEVFEKVLYKNGPAHVSNYQLSSMDVIQLIHDAGGMVVLAHPKLIHDDAVVERLIKEGLDGLEVFYPQHNAIETEFYKNLAKKYHLFMTGGSDFHAIEIRYPQKIGQFTIEDSYAEELYARKKEEVL